MLDQLARDLPPDAVAAIEAFDPERRACGGAARSSPATSRSSAGPVPAGGRGVPRPRGQAARRRRSGGPPEVPPRRTRSCRSSRRAGRAPRRSSPRTSAWSGRATPATASTAAATTCAGCSTTPTATPAGGFFMPRCDRVRVMPFLDGVPCSIHGFVLPDGTAALRPVEIATLRERDRAAGSCTAGCRRCWDPPADDREADARRRPPRRGAPARGVRLPRRVRRRRRAHRRRVPPDRDQHPAVGRR